MTDYKEIAEDIIIQVTNLVKELEELDRQIEKLKEEYDAIKSLFGFKEKDIKSKSFIISKRWVKNKSGKKYFYYYLVVKENGRVVYQRYLGKKIPKQAQVLVDAKKRAKEIKKELERLKGEKERKIRLLKTIHGWLVPKKMFEYALEE